MESGNLSEREPNPAAFLEACEIIDFRTPVVMQLAVQLKAEEINETVKRCFYLVRDEIKHSSDHKLNPVTCSASEVLRHRTGYCYAKSHLLCALLRANQIPAALCYQRLTIDGISAPYCLHGLNAVFLPEIGWYRLDPRGNRPDINAGFTPPQECLAFTTDLPGERNMPELHAMPLPIVVSTLKKFDTWEAVLKNLPNVSEDKHAGGQ